MKRLPFLAMVYGICFCIVACSSNSKNMGAILNDSSPTTVEKKDTSSSDIKLVKKKNKVRYLLTNGVKVTQDERKINTSKGELIYQLPMVSGLVNKGVEEKLNNKIIDECDKEIKRYTDQANVKPYMLETYVTINANNLLAFRISAFYSGPQMGFLFRLTDGERLRLKDIFTEGTSYVDLLKEMYSRQILYSKGEEDYMLSRSGDGITSEQDFVLNENCIVLIFPFKVDRPKVEDMQDLRESAIIPLEDIDDYVHIFDIYSGSERKIHQRLELIERQNNIILKEHGEIFNLKKGKIYSQYPQIVGLKDKSFEEVINTTIDKSIYEGINAVDSFTDISKPYGEEIANVNININFNYYGYLTLEREIYGSSEIDKIRNKWFMLSSFDVVKNKKVDMENILVDYLKDKPDMQLKFAEVINKSLKSKSKDLILSYDDILDKGVISFEKGSELKIIVYFTSETNEEWHSTLSASCPLKEIVNVTPEEFFGN